MTSDASGFDEEDELLTEERRERATPITRKELNEEAKWQSKLELLRQYKQENGHCRVPQSYEIDGVKLGSWLSHQRVAYKKHSEGKPSRITQERIDQLEAVGLDFNDTKQKRDEAQWQSKLELLRQYREQHGHCRVPQRYEINGVKLGNWLSHQRVAYKKHSEGKPARKITQERIDQLTAVGLDFNDTQQKRNEAQWQSKLELLRQYREQNGHCRVPRSYEIDGVKLGIWLNNQRQEYRKHIEGKPAYITQERINELTAIGVKWCPEKSKKIEEDRLSVDEYSYGRMPTMARRSSRTTRNPPSDRHSSAITNTSSASHPCSGRQQSSQPKSRRLNSGSRKAVALQQKLGFEKDDERLVFSGRFQEEESAARSCLLSHWRAPLENRVTRSKGGSRTATNTTAIAIRHLRKRAAPTIGQSTNTVPERKSPRLNCGKRKRIPPERLVLDPMKNQATVTNQTLAKVKAPDGKTSHSVTRRSSKRVVGECPQATNHPAVESRAKATATDTQWDEHFERLVEFKWNHGHCRVPVDFCVDDSYHLGQWVVVQRLQHNRLMDGRPSSITADQVERLNAIDFVWKVR